LLNDTTNVSKLLKTTVMHSDILPIFAYQVLFSAVYSSCIVNNFFYKTSTWVFWKTCWNTFWSKATSWYEYWSPYASQLLVILFCINFCSLSVLLAGSTITLN